jgi:hypothetical protein
MLTALSQFMPMTLNDDGTVEIITAGYAGKLENSRGQLCVWHWNGEELTLKADREWQLWKVVMR